MTQDIHPSVEFGEFCVVGKHVAIGENTIIGHHVVIHEGTRIGNNVRIDDHAVIGKKPLKSVMSVLTSDEALMPAVIEDDVLVGTSAIIYRACHIHKSALVADLATIREHVTIGEKTIVGRNTSIENHCHIGARCKLQTNVYISGHSHIDDDCFIAPCVATSNDNYAGRSEARFSQHKGVTLNQGARIGVNATLLPGITVNSDGFIAAGAVATKNVAKEKIVCGVPAREFKDVPPDQLLKNQKPK